MVARPHREVLSSQFLTNSFQRGLAHWNRERLAPGFPQTDRAQQLDRDQRMLRLEGGFLETLKIRHPR
jgi:hypothetical protein